MFTLSSTIEELEEEIVKDEFYNNIWSDTERYDFENAETYEEQIEVFKRLSQRLPNTPTREYVGNKRIEAECYLKQAIGLLLMKLRWNSLIS